MHKEKKRKKCQTRVNPLLTHRYISLWNTENLQKTRQKQTNKKKNIRKKEAYIYSNECGRWLRPQQPTSDLLTVWRCDVHRLLQEGEGHRLTGFLQASPMRAGDPHPPTPTHHPPTPPSTHKAGPLIYSLWNANTTSSLLHQHGYDWTFSSPPPPPAAMHIWKNSRGPVDAGSIFLKRWRWWENKVVVVVGGGGGQDFYCTAKQLHCGGLLIRRTTQPGEDVCRTGVLFRNTLFSSRKKKIKWTS